MRFISAIVILVNWPSASELDFLLLLASLVFVWSYQLKEVH